MNLPPWAYESFSPAPPQSDPASHRASLGDAIRTGSSLEVGRDGAAERDFTVGAGGATERARATNPNPANECAAPAGRSLRREDESSLYLLRSLDEARTVPASAPLWKILLQTATVTACIVGIFFLMSWATAGAVTIDANADGGGGGFDQLPRCYQPYYGVTLFGIQGHNWYCAYGADHWVIVG